MNFATFEFAIFLLVVYFAYRILPFKGQNKMLLVASYYFYGSWDWRFLGLIIGSTITDFFIGKLLYSEKSQNIRQQLLALSLVINLGLLSIFKYFNFFSDSLDDFLRVFGVELSWLDLNIILPVGISFYTFQTLSYTIDIYRGKLKPVNNFLDFALFVSFFPQLVAGPIERASNFIPQILAPRVLKFQGFTEGCFLILFGLFKKVAIADGIASSVDSIYNSTGTLGTLDIILATYCFAIQIYCDFSGYTDIARGVSKLLGFELMVNFNLPYFAVNPSDFWRRWHISLSTWLRDYLYIPLGGNRQGTRKTYLNLMTTMTLGGLWHGAAWNFIYWGIYQGTILCIHRLIAGPKPSIQPVTNLWKACRRIIIVICFFQIICYGWLLFRATSFEQILRFTDLLFLHPDFSQSVIPKPPLSSLFGIAFLFCFELIQGMTRQVDFYRHWPAILQSAVYASILFILFMGFSNDQGTFIYFQF